MNLELLKFWQDPSWSMWYAENIQFQYMPGGEKYNPLIVAKYPLIVAKFKAVHELEHKPPANNGQNSFIRVIFVDGVAITVTRRRVSGGTFNLANRRE